LNNYIQTSIRINLNHLNVANLIGAIIIGGEDFYEQLIESMSTECRPQRIIAVNCIIDPIGLSDLFRDMTPPRTRTPIGNDTDMQLPIIYSSEILKEAELDDLTPMLLQIIS